MKITPEERSWILYDVGNSAFALIVITTVMPLFFKEYASQGVENAVSTSNWAFANSLSSLLVAVSAPIIGTFADYQGLKKMFFSFFLLIGAGSTFLFTTVGTGEWIWCLFAYVAARFGFAGANIFYDSFLTDITTREKMDRVSAHGYAWGYIGSVLPFLVVMGLLFSGMQRSGSGSLPPTTAKTGFIIVGVWWLAFAVPMLKNVRQRYFVPPSRSPVREGLRRFIDTFREIRRFRAAFLFLIAYFFYIDGVDTIITMATAYGVDIGLPAAMLIAAILMIQVVAFPFALLYGRLALRYGAKTMLYVGILIYCLITLVAFYLPILASIQVKTTVFWMLAFLVATSMGGIQALSRSIFGKLIPAERSGEFFGFYNIFGRFAAISGPLLMGFIGRASGESRYGVLSIFVLFIIGGIILKEIDLGD